MIADVQAPADPSDNIKVSMKKIVTHEPAVFDDGRKIFGNMGGLAVLKDLAIIKETLNIQDDKIQHQDDKIRHQDDKIRRQDDKIQNQEDQLGVLSPVIQQMRLVRKPILQTFAHSAPGPQLRQARNGVAHGGQLQADLSIIDAEPEITEQDLLCTGFRNLYSVPLTLRDDFMKYRKVTDLMNVRANLLTLEIFAGKSRDLELCTSLLNEWLEWVRNGSLIESYPLTRKKTSTASYEKLMTAYGHANPNP